MQHFRCSDHDPCFFYKIYPDGTRIDISLYVDDGWVTHNAGAAAKADLIQFAQRFKLKFRERPKQFLGLNVDVSPERISISSAAYIEGLAEKNLPRPVDTYRTFATPYGADFVKIYEEAQRRASVPSAELLKNRYQNWRPHLYVPHHSH